MSLTRVEKALSIPVEKIPSWFAHSVTPGKPPEPDVSFLSTEDLQRYNLWKTQRENGILIGYEEMNMSSDLQTAMQNYGTYLQSPAYRSWAAVDAASRMMQYRLMLVDVAEAVNGKSTVPPSADPFGTGTPAPSLADIGAIGQPPIQLVPDYVGSGDPFEPELVFGDDGDIVTVS